jgi:hypothetical protein
VTLTGVWIHDVLSPTNYIRLNHIEAAEDFDVPGEVREYAGGVRRAVRRPGNDVSVTYTVPLISPDDFENLRQRIGTVQLVRDSRGRCGWWRLSALSGTDLRARSGPLYSTEKTATFKATKVSYIEEV